MPMTPRPTTLLTLVCATLAVTMRGRFGTHRRMRLERRRAECRLELAVVRAACEVVAAQRRRHVTHDRLDGELAGFCTASHATDTVGHHHQRGHALTAKRQLLGAGERGGVQHQPV